MRLLELLSRILRTSSPEDMEDVLNADGAEIRIGMEACVAEMIHGMCALLPRVVVDAIAAKQPSVHASLVFVRMQLSLTVLNDQVSLVTSQLQCVFIPPCYS